MIQIFQSGFERDKIEKLFRRILPFFFIIVFSSTVIISFIWYLKHHGWIIAGWLINYQGGFIRRGFLGECLFHLSLSTHINPGFYVVLIHALCYGAYFYFSYTLLKICNDILPYIFLIFSPFLFLFQLNDYWGGFRKEILYFAYMGFIMWSAVVKKHKHFECIFFISLLIYPFLILSHEILAVTLPYVLIVYFSVPNIKIDKKRIVWLILTLSMSVLSFILILIVKGSTELETKIFKSLIEINYPSTIKDNEISWLSKDIFYGMRAVFEKIKGGYLLYYPQVLLISLTAFDPIKKKFVFLKKNVLLQALFSISLFGTLILCVVGTDWGRFLYIHLVSFFYLSFIPRLHSPAPIHNNDVPVKNKERPKIKVYLFIVLLIYSTGWKIPTCNGFNLVNVYTSRVNDNSIYDTIRPFMIIYNDYQKIKIILKTKSKIIQNYD